MRWMGVRVSEWVEKNSKNKTEGMRRMKGVRERLRQREVYGEDRIQMGGWPESRERLK